MYDKLADAAMLSSINGDDTAERLNDFINKLQMNRKSNPAKLL